MPRPRTCIRLAIALLTALPGAVSAQSIWLDQRYQKSISLEILKPNLDGDDNTTVTTSAVFASLRVPVGNGLVVVGEVPFAHWGLESDFGGGSENTIGNPYLGLELQVPASPTFLELGIRAPLASEDNSSARFVGVFTDIDRFEAFLTDIVPITAVLNYRYRSVSGLVTRFRGGLAAWINTEGDDSEVVAAYSGQVGYGSEQLNVIGGFTGRAVLTEEGLDFGERTLHHLGAAASIGLGTVRPGVHVRLPLDDDTTDFLDFVIGLNVSIKLR